MNVMDSLTAGYTHRTLRQLFQPMNRKKDTRAKHLPTNATSLSQLPDLRPLERQVTRNDTPRAPAPAIPPSRIILLLRIAPTIQNHHLGGP